MIKLIFTFFAFVSRFIELNLLKKIFFKKKFFKLTKKNFYSWMRLTKKERYELTNKDSIFYLNQRKNLLSQIRKEYKSIPKKYKKN